MGILLRTFFLIIGLFVAIRTEDIEAYSKLSATTDAKSKDIHKILKACEYGVKHEDSDIIKLLIANNAYAEKYWVRIQVFKKISASSNIFLLETIIFLFKDESLWYPRETKIGESIAGQIGYEEKLNELLVKSLKKDYGTKYDFSSLENRKKILVELEQALASYIKTKDNKDIYNHTSAVDDAKSKSLAKIEDAFIYGMKHEDWVIINLSFSNNEYGDKHEVRSQLFKTLSAGSNEFILKTLILLFKNENLWVKYEEKISPNVYTKELSEERLNGLLAKCLKFDAGKKYTFDTQESRKKILIELEKALEESYTKEK